MKKGFFFFIGIYFLSMNAFANCPDLSGIYSFKGGNNTITLTIKTTMLNGKTTYNFNRSNVGGKPWIWESVGDGRSYDKKLSDDYTNVKEVAFCKDGKLHRKLTGDWINGDDLVPFVVQTEMSNPTQDSFLWKTDFFGYGIRDKTEETYHRQ